MLFKPGKSVSFDEPVEMLKACHDRVKAFCSTLQKLQPHIAKHGADEQARQAAANIIRYFTSAAKHHHEDEENDLFPRLLLAAKQQHDASLIETIQRLQQEHGVLAIMWSQLEPALQKISEGQPVILEAATIEPFIALYAHHIATEEEEVFDYAAHYLNVGDIQAISEHMVQRRKNTKSGPA